MAKEQIKIDEVINVSLNSFEEGLISKEEAKTTIMDVIEERIQHIKADFLEGLTKSYANIDNMVEEQFNRLIHVAQEYPMNSMSLEEALELYNTKGVILNCEKGNVVSVHRETKIA